MKYLVKTWIIAWLGFGASAMATDYYVNPTGNNLWSGTLKTANVKLTDGPFKTLEPAKSAIRALKQTNTFNDKVTVNIATGRYYPSQALNSTSWSWSVNNLASAATTFFAARLLVLVMD